MRSGLEALLKGPGFRTLQSLGLRGLRKGSELGRLL